MAARLQTSRLVTLTGAGGSGKTRLALELAATVVDDYADGAIVVELASLSDPALVPQTVARAVGLRERADDSTLAALLRHLETQRLLLLVDNCEHLLAACASLAEMVIRRCPGVAVLATSREALRVAGEVVYRVPPLDVPPLEESPRPAALVQHDAVQLFVDRATAAGGGFALTEANAAAVAEVCRRLGGIPLALELAAARTRGMSVRQIAGRLNQQFQLLTTGNRAALPRQHTLRATLDWSYALLTEGERVFFRRLAAFAGSFSLEAEAVGGAGAPDLAVRLLSLVDKSLVVASERHGEAHYHLLETVRQYALDQLVSAGEVEDVSRRHRVWYVALVDSIGTGLWDEHQKDWLERLEAEHDNLRIVLAWCRDHDPASGLRLATRLWRFWIDWGYLDGGRGWLEALLAPDERAEREACLTLARSGLDAQAFALAWAEGQEMTLESAIACALIRP